jgi:hypothetical protein
VDQQTCESTPKRVVTLLCVTGMVVITCPLPSRRHDHFFHDPPISPQQKAEEVGPCGWFVLMQFIDGSELRRAQHAAGYVQAMMLLRANRAEFPANEALADNWPTPHLFAVLGSHLAQMICANKRLIAAPACDIERTACDRLTSSQQRREWAPAAWFRVVHAPCCRGAHVYETTLTCTLSPKK